MLVLIQTVLAQSQVGADSQSRTGPESSGLSPASLVFVSIAYGSMELGTQLYLPAFNIEGAWCAAAASLESLVPGRSLCERVSVLQKVGGLSAVRKHSKMGAILCLVPSQIDPSLRMAFQMNRLPDGDAAAVGKMAGCMAQVRVMFGCLASYPKIFSQETFLRLAEGLVLIFWPSSSA